MYGCVRITSDAASQSGGIDLLGIILIGALIVCLARL